MPAETNFELKGEVHFVGEYSFYCLSCGPVKVDPEDGCPTLGARKTLRTIEVLNRGDEWKVVCTCDVCELIAHVFVRQP